MNNSVTYKEYSTNSIENPSTAELRFSMRSGNMRDAAKVMGQIWNKQTDEDKLTSEEQTKKAFDKLHAQIAEEKRLVAELKNNDANIS